MSNEKFYWGIVGQSDTWYCKPLHAPDGSIQMVGPPASVTDVAQADGTWLASSWNEWVATMEASDSIMLRETEDIWTAINPNQAPDYVKDLHDEKIALRDLRPVEPT